MSPAEEWRLLGLEATVIDPFPEGEWTSDELGYMGHVGVILTRVEKTTETTSGAESTRSDS